MALEMQTAMGPGTEPESIALDTCSQGASPFSQYSPETARHPSKAGAQETPRNSAFCPGTGTLHVACFKGIELLLKSVSTSCPPDEKQAAASAPPSGLCPTPMHQRSPPRADETGAPSNGLGGCRISAKLSRPFVEQTRNVLQSRNSRPPTSSLLLEAQREGTSSGVRGNSMVRRLLF